MQASRPLGSFREDDPWDLPIWAAPSARIGIGNAGTFFVTIRTPPAATAVDASLAPDAKDAFNNGGDHACL